MIVNLLGSKEGEHMLSKAFQVNMIIFSFVRWAPYLEWYKKNNIMQ